VDRPTFTRNCKSAINWLDYGNSFSGIQTDCLWQTICILERQLLVSVYAEPTFKLLDVIKQKQWRKSSLRSLSFSWQCTSAQVIGCSASSLQLFFVQLNHPAYSPDLAPSNYFQIRNLKYRLRRTWFIDDESLKIDVKTWSESRNRKVYFQGISSWEQKLKICIDVAWKYVKNDSMCDIIAKLQKFLIAPRT